MSPAGKFRKNCEAALAIDPGHIDAMLDMVEFYYQAPGVAEETRRRPSSCGPRHNDPTRGYRHKRISPAEEGARLEEDRKSERKALNPIELEALSLAALYTSESFQKYDESEQFSSRGQSRSDTIRRVLVLAQLYVLQIDGRTSIESGRAEKTIPEDLTPTFRQVD